MIMKGDEKQPPSFIPNKPAANGLIHFYKKGADWNFMTEEDYTQKKAELPPLSFATRHRIDAFNDKPWPDL